MAHFPIHQVAVDLVSRNFVAVVFKITFANGN